MKRNRLLLVLAIVVVLTMVLASCKCTHEEYTDWTITKDPTATATGTAERKCVKCGEPETKTIPELNDTSVWTKSATESVEPTHSTAGKDVYTSEYGTVTVPLDPIDHTFDQEVAEAKYLKDAATCTTVAVYYKSCSCGVASTTLTFNYGKVLGHDAHHHDLVPATCETDGTKEHWTCSREEGKYFTSEECTTEVEDGIVIGKLGHDAGEGVITVTTEPTLDAEGHVTFTCVRENCPATDHIVTLDLAKLSDTTVWTVNTTPADYEHPETTTYTHKVYASVVITKTNGSPLALPYAGKSYAVVEIDGSRTSLSISGSNNIATVNATGDKAIGNAYPLNVERAITSFDGENGTLLINGISAWIDTSTGLIVMLRSVSSYDDFYLFIPVTGVTNTSEAADRTAAVTAAKAKIAASQWGENFAVTYTADATPYGIFVTSDSVTLGVTFTDDTGAALAADACKTSEHGVIVSKGETIVAAFETVDSALVKYSRYTNGSDTLKVYTDGTFAIGAKKGAFTVSSDDTLDAYVIVDGKKIEHYTITLADDGTYTLADVKAEITFVVGEGGTLEQTVQSLYVGCVITAVPTVNSPETTAFVGWYTDLEDDETLVTSVPAAAATLYAKYSTLVTYHVVDAFGGNKDVRIPAGQKVVDYLPKYSAETINSANNTIFANWQYSLNASEGTLASDMLAGEGDEGMTLTSNWADAGRWNTFGSSNSAQFVYNAEKQVWRVTRYGNITNYAEITAIGGKIVVSFKYYIVGNSTQDTLTIRKNTTAIVNNINGQTSGASTPTEIKCVLEDGETLRFQTKYYSLDNGTNGIFISDLIINGREITNIGEYDKLEGTYTCTGKDDFVIDGFGNFTLGDLTGKYTVDASDRTKITANVMDGSNIVGQYSITLSGQTYVSTTTQVTVTYHYGIMGAGNGDKLGEATNSKVDIYSTIELPTPIEISGYVFLGWYTGLYSSSTKVTSINPSKDMDVYARYAESVTLTFKHNAGEEEDKIVFAEKGKAIGLFMYDMPDSVKVEGKSFAGWFTLDGTDTDEWGTEITSETVVSADTIAYARWVTPHVLAGTWTGYEIYGATTTRQNQTITIALTGTAIGAKSGVVTFDSATGYGTIGNRYLFADLTANAMLVSDGKEDSFLGSSAHDSYFLFKAQTVTTVANNILPWNSNTTRVIKFVVDGQDRWVYVDGATTVVFDVTVTITDASGNAVTDNTKYKTYGNVLSISDSNGLNVSKVYNGTTWVDLDGNQGTYTDSVLGTITVDGIKRVVINDNSYDYSVVSEGVIGVTINGQYYEISNMNGATCTVTPIIVTVKFDIANGSVEGVNEQGEIQVSANVAFDLPTPTVETGYKFCGWYDNAEYTGNAITAKQTLSKDAIGKIYYARVEAIPDWSDKSTASEAVFDADGKTTISGQTTADFKTSYTKLVIETDGVYDLKGSTATNSGGSGTAYVRFAILNAQGNALTNLGNVSYNSTYNGPFVLTAGTYYFQTAFGGQVAGSTNNTNKWGTFNVTIQRRPAMDYTVGSVVEISVEYPTISVNNVSNGNAMSSTVSEIVYAVNLVKDVTYTLNFSKVTVRSQLAIRIAEQVVSPNTNLVTTGWIDVGKTATKEFSVNKTDTYYILNKVGNEFSIVSNVVSEPNFFGGKTYEAEKSSGWSSSTKYTVKFDATGNSGTIARAVYVDGQPTMDSNSYSFTAVTIDEEHKTVKFRYNDRDISAIYTDTTIVFTSNCGMEDLNDVTVTTSTPIQGNGETRANPFRGKTFTGKYTAKDGYGFDEDNPTNIEIVFEDSDTISGTLKVKDSIVTTFSFTATLEGTTLTITFTSGDMWTKGKTLIGNISGNKITFSQGTYAEAEFSFYNNGSVTCEGFSL